MYLLLHENVVLLARQRSDHTFRNIPDDESSLDVSSPREINSPSVSNIVFKRKKIILFLGML